MFYAFEYFIFLNKSTPTLFYINNITDDYLQEIKELFKERYDFDEELLDYILPIVSIRDYLSLKHTLEKALFLDLRSFDNLHPFLSCKCVVYANDTHTISTKKDIALFGYYDYQHFNIKEKLKFNFDIFRPIEDVKTDTAFVSAPNQVEDIMYLLPIKESNVIFKPKQHSVTSLFESFDTLYYYHSTLDKNNRFIVESMYFNKDVNITYTGEEKDSVYLRYNDIIDNGIEQYRLTDEDLIIKEMLKDLDG